jgi:hypothetical protein
LLVEIEALPDDREFKHRLLYLLHPQFAPLAILQTILNLSEMLTLGHRVASMGNSMWRHSESMPTISIDLKKSHTKQLLSVVVDCGDSYPISQLA